MEKNYKNEYVAMLLENRKLRQEIEEIKTRPSKHKGFTLGPITSFRRFPDNYHNLNSEEKRACDIEAMGVNPKDYKNNEHVFYYAEVIFKEPTKVQKEKELVGERVQRILKAVSERKKMLSDQKLIEVEPPVREIVNSVEIAEDKKNILEENNEFSQDFQDFLKVLTNLNK